MTRAIVVDLRKVHDQLLAADTLRPEDRDMLRAIFEQGRIGEDAAAARGLREYYGDADRADRTPRSLLYFHIGILCGAVLRRESERREP